LRSQLDQSDSAFRQRVIEIINQVQDAYWDLVFAIRNEKIARSSVDLAKTQLENNRRMVEAGTLAPIELRSTEATLETNQANVIVALQQITTSENVLKALIIGDPNDKLWFSKIVPTDNPVEKQPTVSLQEATALALKNRPELEQLRQVARQNQVNIQFFKNQLKPQIDFQGFYTTNGLAGTPSSVVRSSGGFDSVTQGFLTNLDLALGKLGLPLFNPPVPAASLVGDVVPSQFNGGYGQALSLLFQQKYRTFQVGVVFSFPWKNTTAQNNLGASLAQATQTDARMRQLTQQIQVDVRNGMQALESARLRLEAQHAAAAAAGAQYAGEQERFRAGLSTNFQLLQRLNDLIAAQGNEVRALTDYNKALADLQRVTGTTLISNNVEAPQSVDSSQSGSKSGTSSGKNKK
jgi:HAE1 family hydrophobic/amphiphilic exporter-1